MKPANDAMQAWALALRALILPLTFLMVYPMMVGVDLRELLRPGGLRLQGVTLAVNFVLLPAIGYALGLLFFPEQPMLRLGKVCKTFLPDCRDGTIAT